MWAAEFGPIGECVLEGNVCHEDASDEEEFSLHEGWLSVGEGRLSSNWAGRLGNAARGWKVKLNRKR
jgi:hypothetical protein